MKRYKVVAGLPFGGYGSSADTRSVGPFESRRLAEDAAARMVTDSRQWGSIRIMRDDEEEDLPSWPRDGSREDEP